MSEGRPPRYVCGHTAAELERLELQGAFYADITARVFRAAGIGPGMRVLDIGCGAGDVSLLVADLVGPSGSVLGVDRAPDAVTTATGRSAARGNVAFRVADIGTSDAGALGVTLDGPFDALVGRFVLMHQAEPARVLRDAARHVRPGGIVAMVESHMSAFVAGPHSSPHSRTYDRIVRWKIDAVRAAGAHADMGLRLRETFIDAGLPAPELRLESRVEGGPDAAIYRYVIDSLRSMLPLAEEFGIVALSAAEVEELDRTLRSEVVASGGVLVSWPVVGAWSHV